MKHTKNKKAYSIIIVILIIGFLMVLTIGILKLVMAEMRDNNALWDYSKAYIWAESAQELALLEIKEKSYWYNEALETGFKTTVLWDTKKDPKINYTNDGKVKSYSWTVEPLWYNIIPLFYIDINEDEKKITDYNLTFTSNKQYISWNILSKNWWISNTWENTASGKQRATDNSGNLTFAAAVGVSSFLNSNNQNYLIIFNSSETEKVTYTIRSDSYFTKPELHIISTSNISQIRQNIKTTINYADIVNRSKYSIYSWN